MIANSPASDYTKYFPGWDVLHVPDKEFKLKIIMIDQKTACINSKDKKILDYLRKHHVDTEYTPLRNCERWHQFAHWLYIDILRQGQPHDHLFHAILLSRTIQRRTAPQHSTPYTTPYHTTHTNKFLRPGGDFLSRGKGRGRASTPLPHF